MAPPSCFVELFAVVASDTVFELQLQTVFHHEDKLSRVTGRDVGFVLLLAEGVAGHKQQFAVVDIPFRVKLHFGIDYGVFLHVVALEMTAYRFCQMAAFQDKALFAGHHEPVEHRVGGLGVKLFFGESRIFLVAFRHRHNLHEHSPADDSY